MLLKPLFKYLFLEITLLDIRIRDVSTIEKQ